MNKPITPKNTEIFSTNLWLIWANGPVGSLVPPSARWCAEGMMLAAISFVAAKRYMNTQAKPSTPLANNSNVRLLRFAVREKTRSVTEAPRIAIRYKNKSPRQNISRHSWPIGIPADATKKGARPATTVSPIHATYRSRRLKWFREASFFGEISVFGEVSFSGDRSTFRGSPKGVSTGAPLTEV